MGFFKKMTNKITETVASSASDSVKTEVKIAAKTALPAVFTVGGLIFGIVMAAKGNKIGEVIANPVPTAKSVQVITNNYFLDSRVTPDILKFLNLN